MSGDFAFFDFRSPLVVGLLRVSFSPHPAVGGGMRGIGEDFSPALLSYKSHSPTSVHMECSQA